jgi:hypothetical protein
LFPVIHRPLTSNGTKYSVHHLQPFRQILQGHGRDGSDITVRVSYHSHVYSTADAEASLAHRFQDEGGNWRSFCPIRHANSLLLPQICNDMIVQNYPSWVSPDQNRQNNMAVSDAHASEGFRYFVFYSVSPSNEENVGVELVVKSAFEKEIRNLRNVKKTGVRQVIKTCYFKEIGVP